MERRESKSVPPVIGSPVGQALPDPLVEPLVAKIIDIGHALDDLRNLIGASADQVRELFRAATLLTRERAAETMDISESQLDREAANGAISPIRIDRRPRYSLIDMEAFINSRRASDRKPIPRRQKPSESGESTASPSPSNPPIKPKPKNGAKRARLSPQRLKQTRV